MFGEANIMYDKRVLIPETRRPSAQFCSKPKPQTVVLTPGLRVNPKLAGALSRHAKYAHLSDEVLKGYAQARLKRVQVKNTNLPLPIVGTGADGLVPDRATAIAVLEGYSVEGVK